MKTDSKKQFRIMSDISLFTPALFWLGACLLGCIFSRFCDIPSEYVFRTENVNLPSYDFHLGMICQASFWHYILFSAKWDIVFLFLLFFLIRIHIGNATIDFVFATRGFLFGICGSGLLSESSGLMPFRFFSVLIRHVLLTALYLCYTASLFCEIRFSTAEILNPRSGIYRLFTLTATVGLSLLIQLIYIILLIKI